MKPPTFPRLVLGIVLILVAALLIALDLRSGGDSDNELDRGAIPVDDLAQLLAELPVEPEHGVGYDRDRFRHWIDADNNCFNTRHEVLRSEAIGHVQVDVGTQCMVRAGDWVSIYDGLETTDPADLDIDHVIPLAEAWDSGAWAWSDSQREAFANDLGHDNALVAVSQQSNRQKGRSDPSEWLPPSVSVQCWYTQAWIEVKARWKLSVDEFEHRALIDLLDRCA